MSFLPMPPLCHAKIMLLGMWKCTFDETNPDDCQLHESRSRLGFPERGDYHDWYLWVRSLSDERAEEIYERHMVCIECKEKVISIINNQREKEKGTP